MLLSPGIGLLNTIAMRPDTCKVLCTQATNGDGSKNNVAKQMLQMRVFMRFIWDLSESFSLAPPKSVQQQCLTNCLIPGWCADHQKVARLTQSNCALCVREIAEKARVAYCARTVSSKQEDRSLLLSLWRMKTAKLLRNSEWGSDWQYNRATAPNANAKFG